MPSTVEVTAWPMAASFVGTKSMFSKLVFLGVSSVLVHRFNRLSLNQATTLTTPIEKKIIFFAVGFIYKNKLNVTRILMLFMSNYIHGSSISVLARLSLLVNEFSDEFLYN